MTALLRTCLILILLLSTFTGCASLPHSSPLPDGMTVRSIGRADAGAPLAISKGGLVATVSGEKVEIVPGRDGNARELVPAKATALSFSPGGDKIAVALASPKGTLLRLYDLNGAITGETDISGTITAIAWRGENYLVIGAMIIHKFSFGTQMVSLLYTWDGKAPAKMETLNDTTTKRPSKALRDEDLLHTFSMVLSPYGDEIAYSYLKDPPLFPPYESIVVRHLETGKESEVAKAAPGSAGPAYSPDGERVLVGDAEASSRWFALPDGIENGVVLSSATRLIISPGGRYLLMDGQLYREEAKIVTFPADATAAFLPDGSGLALGYRGNLYLVSGLTDAALPSPPKDRERILELRRLRSLGKISNSAFKKERKKLSAP